MLGLYFLTVWEYGCVLGVLVCFWLCGCMVVFLAMCECGCVFGCVGLRVCFGFVGVRVCFGCVGVRVYFWLCVSVGVFLAMWVGHWTDNGGRGGVVWELVIHLWTSLHMETTNILLI